MIIEQQSIFQGPQSSLIWRYMDFTKFVWFLHESSLYFSRIDKLGDPFEGELSNPSKTYLQSIIGSDHKLKPLVEKMIELYPVAVKATYANCWHINEYESAAMWKVYLAGDEGVAIQSTFMDLKYCLKKVDDTQIHLCEINYLNYEKDLSIDGSIITPFTNKRKSFQYEHELRALIQDSNFFNQTTEEASGANPIGILVPIDILELQANIYVSPTSPDWFMELVKNIVSKYDFTFNIKKSELSKIPQ